MSKIICPLKINAKAGIFNISVVKDDIEELVVNEVGCGFDDVLEVHGGAMALETQSCAFDDALEVHSTAL